MLPTRMVATWDTSWSASALSKPWSATSHCTSSTKDSRSASESGRALAATMRFSASSRRGQAIDFRLTRSKRSATSIDVSSPEPHTSPSPCAAWPSPK